MWVITGETLQADMLANFPTKEPTGKPGGAGWNLGSQLKILGLGYIFLEGSLLVDKTVQISGYLVQLKKLILLKTYQVCPPHGSCSCNSLLPGVSLLFPNTVSNIPPQAAFVSWCISRDHLKCECNSVITPACWPHSILMDGQTQTFDNSHFLLGWDQHMLFYTTPPK